MIRQSVVTICFIVAEIQRYILDSKRHRITADSPNN
jgi:hypothetical protein